MFVDARSLPDGHVLTKSCTSVMEMNWQGTIVWDYVPPGGVTLHHDSERLPNGNTLITEGNKGHVIEVTDRDRIVWEFYNPDINIQSKKRAAIYRLTRITNPENYKYLKDLN